MFAKKINYLKLNIANKGSHIILSKKLEAIKINKAEALFIDIEGRGCKLTKAIQIADEITNFKLKNKNFPIFTFGNDLVTGACLIPILAGDKVFVDKNTMFGLFDFNINKTFINKYLDHKKYQIKLITKGDHKIRLNNTEPLKPEDKQWVEDLLVKRKELFLNSVRQLREKTLTTKSNGELENYLNSKFLSPSDAVKIGLVDGFHSVDTYRFEKYPTIKLQKCNFKISEYIKNFTKISSSFNNINANPFDIVDAEIDESLWNYYNENVLYNNLI